MRKTLKSTNPDDGDRYKKWKFQPKRIAIPSSSWCNRNDSTNIDMIMRQNLYLSPENIKKNAKVERKCCLSTNTCYCVDKSRKNKPSIISKPNSCVTLKNIQSRIPEDDLKRISLQCLCQEEEIFDLATGDDDTELLKRLEEVKSRKSDKLEYTEQRDMYEKFREEEKKDEIRAVEELEHEHLSDEQVSTILGTKHEDTNTLTSNKVSDDSESLEDVETFRKNHYFETHSVKELEERSRTSSAHTCVHKFFLDGRFLPSPVNKDVFGRSVCAVCSKPMMGSSVQLSKGYFSQKPTTISLKNYAKGSEYGLIPRTINVGGKRSKIEVKLGTEDLEKFGRILGKFKKPEYCNSLALRQQKMMTY